MNSGNLQFKYIERNSKGWDIVEDYVVKEYMNAEIVINFLYDRLRGSDDMSDDDDPMEYYDKAYILCEEEDSSPYSYWGHYGEAMEGFMNCFKSSDGVALFHKGEFTSSNIIISFNVYHKISTLFSTLESKNFHEDDYFNGRNIYTQTHIGIHKPLKFNDVRKLRVLKELFGDNKFPIKTIMTDNIYTKLAMELHKHALFTIKYRYYPTIDGCFLFAPTNRMRTMAIDYFGKNYVYSINIELINGEYYYKPLDDPTFMILKTIPTDHHHSCDNADIGVYLGDEFFKEK